MENDFNGSANAGSSAISGAPSANSLGGAAGQAPKENAPQIDPGQHAELEKLVGKQGAELGEFRKFFSDISPLLDKLNSSPELVQAIVDGKVTGELAKAAMDGKVTISDAEVVEQAHKEVKGQLGEKEYKGTSPEEISNMIEKRATEIKEELQKDLKQRDELSAFEANVNEFIASKSDFKEYADAIDKWLDEHEVTDISVAYYAVKGQLSEGEAKKQADADKAEFEKGVALNMGAGGGMASRIPGSSNIVDSLIAGKTNPNVF